MSALVSRRRSVLAGWLGIAAIVLVAASCGGNGRRTAATAPPPTPVVAAQPTTTGPTTSTTGPTTSTTGPATSTTGAPAGSTTHGTFQFGTTERTYRLFTPPKPTVLIVALHGGMGSGDQFAAQSRFEILAAKNNFAVVFPDGLTAKTVNGLSVRTWNAGRCCGPAARNNVDDSGFIAELSAKLTTDLGIPAGKVGVVGHSNGAMLTWRIACEHADVIGAAVVVAGSLEKPGACSPAKGISLEAIHGDADVNHPINGGRGNGVAGVDFRSLDSSLDTWTKAEKCGPGAAPVTTGPLTRTTWPDCRDNTITERLVIKGAEHAWPGSAPAAVTRLGGTPSQDLDATAEAWAFLHRALG